jgi:deoxyribodipyrimidine photo-lyase
MTALLWLRRDLRRSDNPALDTAADPGPVLACFVLDPLLLATAGPVRTGWLAATLQALNAELDGRLCVRFGDPTAVIPQLAAQVSATTVHVATETEPAGAARDVRVRAALAERNVGWVETGSPYAITPGQINARHGGGFAAFSAFHRSWRSHGWPAPAAGSARLELAAAPSDPAAWSFLEAAVAACPVPLPGAGERAGLARWEEFLDHGLDGYASARDRPDQDGTSQLSPYLKFGALHPRTLLADLAGRHSEGSERFIAELAWREFYADVAWRHPTSLTTDLNPLPLTHAEPGDAFDAWRDGRTGFPIVDAGQRQLRATGWMHNRVRMITASFLTKDLHVWWPHGAEHFAQHLLDADLASNAHGWQWVAGTGTDAAPYYRVFNPTVQAERFDPAGDYVRRWVPELTHLAGATVHRPWAQADGYARGYPTPIVDHAVERLQALARYRIARESLR